MEDIVWNIPSEKALDRLEELRTYLNNFPESKLAPVIQHEIDHLEKSVKLL